MTKTNIDVPKIAILKLELVINNNLYEDNIITEYQYEEVNKLLYKQINYLKDRR